MLETKNLTVKLSTLALAIALGGCGADLEPSENDLSNAPQFTPPVITSTPSMEGIVGEDYSYSVSATDAENDSLTFSATLADDSWLSFDAATGTLSGIPASGDLGNEIVTLTVNDGTFDISQTYTIAVAGAKAPPTTGNVLKNTTFSSGMMNWSSNSGTTVFEQLIPNATGNVYDVNLSQALTLVTNDTYTFKFDAKSSVERTIVAGIGLAHDPWDNVTEIPELSTTWQSYSYTLTPLVGDANSRTIFDMGGATPGDVYLRNIELIDAAGTDLIDGTIPIGSFFEANVTAIGDPSSANLMQTVSIEQGKSYVVSFKAKASVDRNVHVGLGMGDTSSLKTVALTTEWLPLFVVIDATGFGGDASQVIFNMGDEIGDVYLDEIKVGAVLAAGAPIITSTPEVEAIVGETYSYEITAADPENDPLTFSATLPEGTWLAFDPETGVLSGTPTSEDLDTITDVTLTVSDGTSDISQTVSISVRGLIISNGFDQGLTNWVATDNSTIVYEVPVANAGESWAVNYSKNLTLVPAATYTFSFDAKASAERSLIAGIGLAHDPWFANTETPALTTEWQTFTFTMAATDKATATEFGDDNSRILFDMGAEAGDVSLRNIKLIDEADVDLASTATNVVNGGNNFYQVLVAQAGEGWQANLSQVTVIEPAKDYVINFKAKASVARNIIVGVGLNGDPWSSATKDVALTTEWQDYTVEVKSTTLDGVDFGDAVSRVLFDMGAEAGDVSLDDITVEKVIE